MDPLDFGDMSDLRIRLGVLAEEADRHLVTVFGSGISNAVLPGVPQLTELFRQHIPRRGRDKFDETIGAITDPGLKYQNAAALLTRQAGESTVMRAIRSAVLQACLDVADGDVAKVARDEEQCSTYAKSGSWNIPPGYQRFARFFAALDGSVRGPVITTNFDPLVEVALREVGIDAIAVPVPTDSPLTMEQLSQVPAQPVLHIHGYWAGRATSNVPSRITADRPKLHNLLRELLRNSVVLVVGYSGWLDGFMKSLRERVLNEADLLQAEVLWAAYETDPAAVVSHSPLQELISAPGFTLYLGVDGHELFTDVLDRDADAAEEASSPFGYCRVPRQISAKGYIPAHFAEGRQPTWADAEPDRWPTLSSTLQLEEGLRAWLDAGGGGGVIAVGPLGEGKSLAVRQVAMKIAASGSDWTVLWREPGAPPITESWLREVQTSSGSTLICIDEADLVQDELVATKELWGAGNSGLAFLLASHDRLWWQGSGGASLRPYVNAILFHGIEPKDAENIATAWQSLGLLPDSPGSVADTAARLLASADVMAAQTNTLFGAVLDVRYGSELGSRVEDLLHKLREVRLTDEVTLADVFAGICILQHSLDKDGNKSKGASRPVIAAMVGLDEVFADGKILATLGREAAVTFAGSRVYSRHPAIAATVVEYLHRKGIAEKVYTLVGRAGGALREAGAGEVDGYRDAYLLSRDLQAPEAVWAAKGAVEGTGHLLESRVTLLRALRQEGRSRGLEYARNLAPRVHEYRDFRSAVRAFLVEFSISMREEGHAQTSAGLAALALDDRVGFTLDASRAGYALVSLAKSTLRLNAQTGGTETINVPEVSYVLLELIQGDEQARKFLGPVRNQLKQPLDEFRSLSPAKLCGQLASALDTAAKAASRETDIRLELGSFMSFDSLRRMADLRRMAERRAL
ncbi:SIR2 family protein [Streptomyces sp. NPDC056468]|uniref:P-loop NTPase n=1 Tax=unclassified Streptomyces TaxID=2593676 RepID=UPI0036C58835